MKHLLIFLCGIGVGAVGSLLYLRHDFKQKVTEEVEKIIKNQDKNDTNSADNSGKEEAKSSDSEGNHSTEDRFGELKNAEMEYREAYSKGATDALGYTNYAGEEGSSRIYSADFDPKTGEKPGENEGKNDAAEDKNSENGDKKSYIFGKLPDNFNEKTDENGKMSAPLLENEKWRMRQKSGAFGDFDADFPPEDGNFEPPYGISDEEFYTKDGKFSKKTLFFYAKDGNFSDECATLCANAPLLVGEKWRIEVGKFEENVAFIRNEKIATDFEIVVENDSFGDLKKPDFGEV